jgi:putative endonuclease
MIGCRVDRSWKSSSPSTFSPRSATARFTPALHPTWLKRVWEHREGLAQGFTKEHGVKTLVWYEVCENPMSAITREKQIKAWKRGWKLKLIEEKNPDWRDLYSEICQ